MRGISGRLEETPDANDYALGIQFMFTTIMDYRRVGGSNKRMKLSN